jgi:tRNA nucleotidyltransferase (CCA-adding enzyme)
MPLPAPLRRAIFPAAVLGVLERLAAHGHRSWVVGGAVRDLLLRRPRHGQDFDLATPATPQQVTALFPRVIPTGIEHGTVTILTPDRLKVEVTTFRGEGVYADGRRPGTVTFHTDLEADLGRRDFTINALAFDPLAGELSDPFGGQRDLAAAVIRAVGQASQRFAEDGLRPLRAVRFAGQLGFRLHPATRAAIRGALPVVGRVSRERMADELGRLAVSSHVARAFELLAATGLLEVLAPSLAALPRARLRHLGQVAAAIGGQPPDLTLRLTALFHAAPVAELEALLASLRFPRRVAADVAALAARHACLREGRPEDPVSPAVVRRWLAGVGPERAGPLLELRAAEVAALPPARRPRAAAAARRLRSRSQAALDSGAPLDTGALALDGRGLMALLGCPPGPQVGEGLRHLLDLALDEPGLNTAEALAAAARGWWAGRPTAPAGPLAVRPG